MVVGSNAESSTTKLTGATWSQFAKEQHTEAVVLAWHVGAGGGRKIPENLKG